MDVLSEELAESPQFKTTNMHWEKYNKAKAMIDEQVANIEEYIDIRSYLSKNKINAFKYNYALDSNVQNFTTFDAFIELSKDYKYIQIINRKPNEAVKYILEADPEKLKEARLKEHKEMK